MALVDSSTLTAMAAGLTDYTKEIIIRRLAQPLCQALRAVSADMVTRGLDMSQLAPPPSLILNAFRLCPIDRARVVLVGQDPYICGAAMGLSFSSAGAPPPSLQAIFSCLCRFGLMREYPNHGDLSEWAAQGVLLLNSSLTTVLGTSGAHTKHWKSYTDALIRELSARPDPIIFILLGAAAKTLSAHIDTGRHHVLCWGHPSPLNSLNRGNNPLGFKYCTVFARANELLGAAPINWAVTARPAVHGALGSTAPRFMDPTPVGDEDPAPVTLDTLWVFTDGGVSGAGTAKCKASWAFYMTDGCYCARASGLVGAESSSNRGELTAAYYALHALYSAKVFDYENAVLVSDSEYTIGAIGKWSAQWVRDGTLSDKKNLDIILPARAVLDLIQGGSKGFRFHHTRSHVEAPSDPESIEWFIWRGNEIADRLCNEALGRALS